MPSPDVAFACGSRSTTSERSPASARHAARLIAVVVLPTPPFWFASAKIRPAIPRAYGSTRTFLRERPLPRQTWTARESGRRRLQFVEHEQPRELFSRSAADAGRHAGDRLGIGARPDVEDDRSAPRDERQAPLGGDRRCGEGLRDRDPVALGL